MRKFLTFFLLAMAFLSAVAFWYWRGNIYSKEVLKIEILGPEKVQAGEEINYIVKFKNNGKVRLESAELVFEYPENAIPLEEIQQRITKKLEDIYPGEERTASFKAVVVGKENDTFKAQASLFYIPKNLKARYESKTNLVTKITYIPLTLEFDLPVKVDLGNDLNFTVNYFSNMNYVLENLRLKMIYPSGFSFQGAQPKGMDVTEWALPTLTQANGGRVSIRGGISGERGERKVFKAQIGIIKEKGFIVLKEVTGSVELSDPSVFISQMINGSQVGSVGVGSLLHYEIYFKNIGAVAVEKKFLLVKLNSDFFDLNSLKTENGEIGQGDNAIIFDWKDVPSLRFLNAGDEGKVDFWVKTKDISFNRKITNPILKNSVSLSGVEKVFEIKLQGKIDFVQKVLFENEFIANSGSIPPKIGTSTTYTVLWQMKNYWNGLNNVKIKAVLPNNVKLTGQTSPQSAPFTFDSASREVVWTIGDIASYKGFDSPYILAFQVELLPEISQVGLVAPLIGEAHLTAEDNFSGRAISEVSQAQDTSLPYDVSVSGENGIVR